MQETWVRSLGGEDLLEEGMTTHSSILARKIPMDRGARWAAVCGVAKSDQAQHMPCQKSEENLENISLSILRQALKKLSDGLENKTK